MPKVLDFICTPSFKVIMLWFAMSASCLTAYKFLGWPYLFGCSMYFFVLMVVDIILAWKKSN